MSSIIKALYALAIVSLLALSFVAVSRSGFPASYAVTPQTYYLDTPSGTGSCSGDQSLDYGTAPVNSSSVALNPLGAVNFCNNSVPATIYTQNVTLVLYIASGVTGLNFQATLSDLNTSTSQPTAIASTSLLPASTCSSPTKLTLSLTSSTAGFSAGDTIALAVQDYVDSGSFSICAGGSFASYMTINALPVITVTTTSISTTTATTTTSFTSTTTETSTATSTSTVFVYPTTTHVTCTPDKAKVGQNVACTAIVKDKTTPSGKVTFTYYEGTIGERISETCSPVSHSSDSCSATVDFAFLFPGPATVTAAYSGDATHESSHGATLVHIVK